MTEKQQAECTIESDGTGVFVVFEGVRIAKRGESGTPQAGTWVSLEPCYAPKPRWSRAAAQAAARRLAAASLAKALTQLLRKLNQACQKAKATAAAKTIPNSITAIATGS
jgi:hypothetical protein